MKLDPFHQQALFFSFYGSYQAGEFNQDDEDDNAEETYVLLQNVLSKTKCVEYCDLMKRDMREGRDGNGNRVDSEQGLEQETNGSKNNSNLPSYSSLDLMN